jgi:putative effector of murein hydrolase LrgA (UPF0299 family)
MKYRRIYLSEYFRELSINFWNTVVGEFINGFLDWFFSNVIGMLLWFLLLLAGLIKLEDMIK